MNGVTGDPAGDDREDARRDLTTVRCAADSLDHDLDVSWTKGAIFEFDSVEEAERWVEQQDLGVPGTLFLAEVPDGTDPLDPDYHLKYSSPDR